MNTALKFDKAAQLVDAFTGKPDHGLVRDHKHEQQIDAAYSEMTNRCGDDTQARDAFDRFYRLVLARSQIAQVTIELERRKRNP